MAVKVGHAEAERIRWRSSGDGVCSGCHTFIFRPGTKQPRQAARRVDLLAQRVPGMLSRTR
ncbi:MAG: hypothetical protein JWO93_835 [Micrococcaceae bacterium]|jgi:hypothetical protein|nr:hypothetical protein [Micrococcaceae bacterium]